MFKTESVQMRSKCVRSLVCVGVIFALEKIAFNEVEIENCGSSLLSGK